MLYARRSKHDPANPGKSTTDQLDTQRDRASRLGLSVVAEFTDDGIGASRHSHVKTRPGFVAAVDHLRAHPVEVFALWELSRATRRLRVYSDLMELCEDRGTYLLIGDRIYDPLDPTDQMVLGMTAVQDSAEVARLRERVLRGVASTAAAGRPHGRNVYGYERIYDSKTRQLVEVRPQPEQAAVIQEMVTLTLQEVSANQIARDLTQRGITKPTGALFGPTDIREMLSRPTYRGLRSHNGTLVTGTWPALITDKQWQGLVHVFAQRSRGIHDTTAKHLLTGVAMCDRCRRPMYVDIKKGKTTQAYYHCGVCSRSRNAKHLEAYTVAVVNRMLRSTTTRRKLMREDSPDSERRRTELAALRAELDEAYTVGLSARGLAAVEQRLLPLIERAERAVLAVRDGKSLADLAQIRELPEDPDEARRVLRRLIRVWVGQSRRGRGFDPSTVDILPA